MHHLVDKIQIRVNDNLYLKDPESSDLGKRIIDKSIELIDDMGMEDFTFRKLAQALDSTESSVYRYFENKQRLLLYLTSWYWGFLEYELVFKTNNVESPSERLELAIDILACDIPVEERFGHIDLHMLDRIVISESSKAYLTKKVDESNKEGFYLGYKQLIHRLSLLVLDINPDFQYAHTLMSTIVESIHHQKYFAKHLPALTDPPIQKGELGPFFNQLALSTILRPQK